MFEPAEDDTPTATGGDDAPTIVTLDILEVVLLTFGIVGTGVGDPAEAALALKVVLLTCGSVSGIDGDPADAVDMLKVVLPTFGNAAGAVEVIAGVIIVLTVPFIIDVTGLDVCKTVAAELPAGVVAFPAAAVTGHTVVEIAIIEVTTVGVFIVAGQFVTVSGHLVIVATEVVYIVEVVIWPTEVAGIGKPADGVRMLVPPGIDVVGDCVGATEEVGATFG